MNIHEYQAKELFRRYGVPVPLGITVFELPEAAEAAEQIIRQTGNEVVVVKAQIHAGGRGKAGGVKVVSGAAAAQAAAEKMLGAKLITPQTGPAGKTVQRLLIEQGLAVSRELYLAAALDREARRVAIIGSSEGGVEIEEVAARTPDKIFKVLVDPFLGLMPFQARQLGFKLGLEKDAFREFSRVAEILAFMYMKEDCSLIEINPLVVTKDNRIVALDAKVNFDDNGSFRHKEWEEWRDLSEENLAEIEAKKSDLSYIQLDGNIGCVVNGAGLAMATMDIIKHFGGEPANFLDVGGGAGAEAVTAGFKLILSSPAVKSLLVNIFGGIMRCDVIAESIIAASKEVGLKVPMVARLEGTNMQLGRDILRASGLKIIPAATMAEAARKAVELANWET